MFRISALFGAITVAASLQTFANDDVDKAVAGINDEVIAWRHDIHQHPELSNREFRTAKLVAEHLRGLGFDEVYTDIGPTGVVGVLKGGKPGGVVALRADMDALPVKEQTGLPFASTATGEYRGQTVPVAHACGHDAHVAMLMGAAEVLADRRADIPGTVAFIFQPAEEGAPPGEEGGAEVMIAENALQLAHNPSAIFGIHVWPGPPGQLSYKALGTMAAADMIKITVTGKQTHGSSPWSGIDPIVVSAQLINALQSIPSRQLDVSLAPSVLTIGKIEGGLRGNIIPDQVEMLGTLRNFDNSVRDEMIARIERTVEHVAASFGATATFEIESSTPVTWNDPDLVERMLPTLRRSSAVPVIERRPIMAAEDFSFFQKEIPGFYFFLGVNPDGVSEADAYSNHSPKFQVNDAALPTGVRTLVNVAMDYLEGEVSQ